VIDIKACLDCRQVFPAGIAVWLTKSQSPGRHGKERSDNDDPRNLRNALDCFGSFASVRRPRDFARKANAQIGNFARLTGPQG
jgi:hypothetical protein